MIKILLFDIDNTLLSFSCYVKQTMKEGFSFFGLPAYHDSMYDVFERINNGLWKQIEQGTLTIEELRADRWNLIFSELRFSFDGTVFETYFRKKLYDSAVPEPGAKELLAGLYGHYPLCVASNGPYEQQLHRLSVGDMKQYFRHFFISEKIGVPKPNSEFFDACMRELRETEDRGLLPEEVLMIGDSVSSDIEGAKRYGMKTCLYCGSGAPVEGAEQADYLVSHLLEIRKIVC